MTGKKIFVCGHKGMVGSAIMRRLANENCTIVTADRSELDLRDDRAVKDWLGAAKADAVILAAAKVGGILANDTMPVPFLLDNLRIQNAVINGAFEQGVSKLLFLGSSCIYPAQAVQPMAEDSLLTGPLEATNQWYAIAKITGVKLCQALRKQFGANFISAMPTNLYGPHDNYHLTESHVVAALIRRFHQAKLENHDDLVIWGSGKPLREFLYVDDLADGLVHLLKHYNDEQPINIGTGQEVSIQQLAEMLKDVSGWQGNLVFDVTKPDGAPRKVMQNDRIHALGWQHKTELRNGLKKAFSWFDEHQRAARL
ncbi:GDP-L-fucose synthase [Alphaproteobacteria bacterium]|nr:GDP-L-fucose synthase [Alphaproteobacteria bacterium]